MEHKKKRAKSKPIKVVFNDGTKIVDGNAMDVFMATIEHVGIMRVKDMDFTLGGRPLIVSSLADLRDEGGYKAQAHKFNNNMYISSKLSNDRKVAILREIANKTGNSFYIIY